MALRANDIARLEPGRHFDRDGLYLQKTGTNRGSWLLRYQRHGRERWYGLGKLKNFELTEARKRAKKARQQLDDGIDPIDLKRAQRAQKALEDSRAITFEAAAEAYYKQHADKWTNHKHAAAFLSTLKQYAYPVIGKRAVADIDTADILRILEPHWTTKHQTMARLRGRIELVLGWCNVRGYRKGENVARWAGHLREALPTGGKIAKVVHHAALPYADVPAFMAGLSKQQGVAPRALEFLILCASRSSEVTGALWSEIDFDKRMWVVAAERMKTRTEHRVPLTDKMIKLLKALPREANNDLVFIGSRPGKPLDKMVLPRLLDAMGIDATIHGFRSSFRTWAAEQTAYPREIIEAALAHTTGTAVELAYQRSDVLEKRRLLMEQWGTFVSTPRKTGTGTVTPIRKGGV